jgi:hypothetical protein
MSSVESTGDFVHDVKRSVVMAKKTTTAGKVMREFAHGQLHSSSGQKVTKPAQAKAIAMSEQRRVGKGKRKK